MIDFIRPDTFDLAYSVLTFLHIENKEKALAQIYSSLRKGGVLVLSVSRDEDWLEYGDRRIQLYPASLEAYIRLFEAAGFRIESVQETEGNAATIIKGCK